MSQRSAPPKIYCTLSEDLYFSFLWVCVHVHASVCVYVCVFIYACMKQCQKTLSGVRKVPKTMGQSLWINISDKPQTFYKCCMNENCQLSIKEYLCWVSFWFVTFPWEETVFNATFILTSQYTLHGTFFVVVAKGVSSFHSFVPSQFLSDKYKILQPIETDSAL